VHDFSDNQVQDEEPREPSPRVSHRSNLSNAISLLRSERKALFLLPLGVLSIVVSSFIVIFIVAAFSGIGTAENGEISCSSVAVILALVSIAGLIIWNFALGSLTAALIRKYRGLEFEFRESVFISLSAAPAIVLYSLFANVVILGTISLTSIDSWPEIESYCRAIVEVSETSETIDLPLIDLASGSHLLILIRIFNFFRVGEISFLLLLGEVILLGWSYMTFFLLTFIIFKKFELKAIMATSFGWTRTRLVSIVFWLLIVEFVQFLVIVPLVSLMGLGGVLLIMPIYLFVLIPLTISYKIIVIQSLIGDLVGQLEESMDINILDTFENSYDPARAL
jgi:hypothetical protein